MTTVTTTTDMAVTPWTPRSWMAKLATTTLYDMCLSYKIQI